MSQNSSAAAIASSDVIPNAEAGAPVSRWQVFSCLDQCRGYWQRIESAGLVNAFGASAWIEAWFRHIGREQGVRPRIVVGFSGTEPVVLFPFGIRRLAGVRILNWLAGEWSDYNTPVIAEASLAKLGHQECQRLFGAALAQAGNADVIDLRKQPIEIDGRPNPLRLASGKPESDKTFARRLSGTPEEALNALHSRSTWRYFQRKARKLAGTGELILRELGCGEERLNAVSAMLAWKSAALGERGSRNPFKAAECREFLAAAATCEPAACRIFALESGGRTVAAAKVMTFGKTFLVYQTAYDPAFGQHSPGALMMHRMIFKAREEGFERFDLSFGNDGYKLAITNEAGELLRTIIARSLRGHAFKALTMAKARILGLIKGNRQVLGAAYGINRRLRQTLASLAL